MKTLSHLFEKNRQWAEKMTHREPGFFEELAEQQHPDYLWIGCSDSRVPANQIVGLTPGKIFVHRNIANQVFPSDMNCMSVVEFAVSELHIDHLIVCGHYGCGGVQAAMRPEGKGLPEYWIENIRETYRDHLASLEHLDERARFMRLCEINVVQQVNRLCRCSVVVEAWKRGEPLSVHGWIYRIEDGLLHDLGLCITGPDEISAAVSAALRTTT